MTSRTFTATVAVDGSASSIAVPFDRKSVFGKVRAPIVVALNGHTFRSTIAVMHGLTFVPLRRNNREAAGVGGTTTVEVTLTLDTQERRIDPPDDLVTILKETPDAWDHWHRLSFTHQREHVEAISGAKKPETRARCIAHVVTRLAIGS